MIFPLLFFGILQLWLWLTFSQEHLYFGIALLIIGFFIAVPAMSFIYSRVILRDSEKRILLTLYNTIVITLSYLLRYCTEDETYVYSLILFAWSFLWGMLGLIKKPKASADVLIGQDQA